MEIRGFNSAFNEILPDRLKMGLSTLEGKTFSGDVGDRFRSDCYRILYRAVKEGQIGPGFEPIDMGYCRMLAAAGFLEERGDKMAPTIYIPTDFAKEFMKDY